MKTEMQHAQTMIFYIKSMLIEVYNQAPVKKQDATDEENRDYHRVNTELENAINALEKAAMVDP